MGRSALDLVVDALAVYRLTRLVTADVITAPARDRIVEAAYANVGEAEAIRSILGDAVSWSEYAEDDPDAPKLATLITCRWCAAIHCSILVVCLRRAFPRAWRPVGEMLALGAAAALVAGLED